MTSDDLLLLKLLGKGIDIRNGSHVPPGYLLLDRDVQQVLALALEQLQPSSLYKRQKRPTLRRAQEKPVSRHGQPWTEPEKAQLAREFRNALDFTTIADRHGRSREAIVQQLIQIGLVPAHCSSFRKVASNPL